MIESKHARLIAAAPEMAEALKAFIAYNDAEGESDVDMMFNYTLALRLSRVALLKAGIEDDEPSESQESRDLAHVKLALGAAKSEAAVYRAALVEVFDAIQAEAKHTTNHDINVCDELLSAFRTVRAAIGETKGDVATEIDEAANEHGDEVVVRAVAAAIGEGENGK